MMPSAVRDGGLATGAEALSRNCWGGMHAETVMRIVGPQRRALTDDEVKPWRRVWSNVLLPEVVMSLQVPLMVQDLTTVIRAGAATDEPVRPCSAFLS